MTDPPAVILGGYNTALSVVRSLGRAGVRVYVLGDASEQARHSRYCHTFASFKNPDTRQERWLEWLASGPRGAVILPACDDGLELIARNRSELLRLGYSTIETEDEAILAMLDKAETYRLARRVGIAAPRTARVRDLEELRSAAEEIGYPCAIKPVHSHRFVRHFNRKGFVARDLADLERAAVRPLELSLELLVTEIIPGPDDRHPSYYGYLDRDGEPLLGFTKRTFRKYPNGWGLSTYSATTRDPEVAEVGLRFLRGVGVHGLVNVQFKCDARDGRLKLMECNPRFTAANELARAAGVDLARFVYNRLTGRPVAAPRSYRVGTYLWHPVNDVRALRGYLASGELTLDAWARSLLHYQHFPLASWGDPLPSIAQHARILQLAARRAAGGMKRRVVGTTSGAHLRARSSGTPGQHRARF